MEAAVKWAAVVKYPNPKIECESEEEQEMNHWIESVQKHSGLPQQAIDSLLTMEFEGG